MRRLLPAALLVAIAVVACSSGSSPAPSSGAGGASPAASEPAATSAPTEAPAEAPAASSATTPEPSIDTSAFGSKYAQIQTELQAAASKLTASMTGATTPDAITAAYKEYADATRKAIAELRTIDWPAPIRGDMDKLLAYEDELVGLYETMLTDPAGADQSRIATISAELPVLAQKIAAYFGVQVAP